MAGVIPDDAVLATEVTELLELSPQATFYELRDTVRARRAGRLLTLQESETIGAVLRKANALAVVAEAQRVRAERDPAVLSPSAVLLCTAYSSDYSIGGLCEAANRQYAERHGYQFESVVLPYADMLSAIAPRAHPTWYKVFLLRRCLSEAAARGVAWIVWIDADAIVIEPRTRIFEDIIRGDASGRELICAEDMHTGCYLNAGVLLVRVCEWSVSLWDDVWADRRYWGVPYYEQGALVAALRARQEGLETVKPFHSFARGGPQGPKLFAHVAVLPTLDLNSNRWSDTRGTAEVSDVAGTSTACPRARFIFHPAGGQKLQSLLRVISDCGLARVLPADVIPTEFRLLRRSHGREPTAEVKAAALAASASGREAVD